METMKNICIKYKYRINEFKRNIKTKIFVFILYEKMGLKKR